MADTHNPMMFESQLDEAALLAMLGEAFPEAELQEPYESARKMLLVDNVDDREFLRELITAMYDELPEPKKKKKGTNKER